MLLSAGYKVKDLLPVFNDFIVRYKGNKLKQSKKVEFPRTTESM